MVRDEQFSPETMPGAPSSVSADTNIYVTPSAARPAPAPQPVSGISPIVGPILTAPVGQAPQPYSPIAPAGYPASEQNSSGSTRTNSTTTTSQRDAQDAAYEAERLTRKTTTKQTTTRTQDMDGPKTKNKTSLNWGGIMKGVAVVTAVVVVGIAAYWGADKLVGLALTNPTIGSLAASAKDLAAPVIHTASEGAQWLSGYAGHIHKIVGGFFSSLFNIGAGGAAANVAATTGTHAAAAALSGEAIKTASKTMGMVAATAGATYTFSHMAAPTLDHTQLLNHSQVTVMPTAHTDITTTVTTNPGTLVTSHASTSADLAAQTEALSQVAAGNSAAHVGHSAADHASHSLHTAAELGLHSYEIHHHTNGAQHDGQSGQQADSIESAPDIDMDGTQNVASRSQRDSWSSRTGSRNNFMDRVKAGGGYGAAVAADRASASRIKAPADDYATEMEERKAAAGESYLG